MKSFSFVIAFFALFFIFCTPADQNINESNPPSGLKLQTVADGLISPVAATFITNDRILVCEQSGMVKLVEKGKINATPFLDLTTKMVNLNARYDERGLLGIALHPQFSSNKKFYVFYSAPSTTPGSNHKGVLVEYKVSANANVADPASERLILSVEEPESNHNGGDIHFGPDGFLYVSLGDGGGAGDKHGNIGNGQNMNTLLGKMLRIDVNKGDTYTVPADNPFVGKADVKPEIWAYGLRNTWRFSFDRKTNQLFGGEVGQDKIEEVNIIEKGGNYGWKIMEATKCFSPADGCNVEGLKLPITEYPHTTGLSIAGGYVYNGKAIPDLVGKYIFADWTGPTFMLEKSGDKWNSTEFAFANKPGSEFRILAFSEDVSGEIYVLGSYEPGPKSPKGIIYKIVKE